MSTRRLRHAAQSVLAVIAAAVVVASTLAPLTTAPAGAADARDFDPGYLISDYAFYDGAAMTQGEIQAFLESKSGVCGNERCLDILRQTTVTRAATAQCARYEGGSNELVSQIIFKVQAACNISAKALLVILEKEQSVVSSRNPSVYAVQYALGYGCPDTAPCDPAMAGIGVQLYSAASQFQRYRLYPSSFRHRIGSMSVATHPRSFTPDSRYSPAQCPFITVTIRNAATAGLYNYTPYTPNAAAMRNLYGSGDSCSAYGNRNFWRLYTDWFGSPTGEMPVGVARQRIEGADRYATSVALSKDAYPNGAPVAYVAVGTDYADGLAAAPAAAAAGAPLLLTTTEQLPEPVRLELVRLRPQSIVVIGGEGVVSAAVAQQLAAIAPVRRDEGVNRFATARQVLTASFPTAGTVYFANGNDFPDALALSAAAGAARSPLLLVPSGATQVDPETVALLRSRGVTSAVISGGSAVVSDAFVQSLRSVGIATTTRYGGANRYETAASINEAAFPTAAVALVASGADFPDALSAAAIAGTTRRPLVLSTADCVPAASIAYMVGARVSTVRFIGGNGVLGAGAFAFQQC